MEKISNNGFEFNTEYMNDAYEAIISTHGKRVIYNTREDSLEFNIKKFIKDLPYNRIFKASSMILDKNLHTSLVDDISDILNSIASTTNEINTYDLYRSKSSGYYIKLKNGISHSRNINIMESEITRDEMLKKRCITRINRYRNNTIDRNDVVKVVSIDDIDRILVDNNGTTNRKPFHLDLSNSNIRHFLNSVIEISDSHNNLFILDDISKKSGISGKKLGTMIAALSKVNVISKTYIKGVYKLKSPKNWRYKNWNRPLKIENVDYIDNLICQVENINLNF
jgi:hypothetical protein